MRCAGWQNPRMKVADGIHRLGPGVVNVYLLEEAGEITIIDAGMPGDWSDLLRELAAMGRTLDDVRALVLTHGHSDHIGFAERARRERGWIPRVHELDAGAGAFDPFAGEIISEFHNESLPGRMVRLSAQ